MTRDVLQSARAAREAAIQERNLADEIEPQLLHRRHMKAAGKSSRLTRLPSSRIRGIIKRVSVRRAHRSREAVLSFRTYSTGGTTGLFRHCIPDLLGLHELFHRQSRYHIYILFYCERESTDCHGWNLLSHFGLLQIHLMNSLCYRCLLVPLPPMLKLRLAKLVTPSFSTCDVNWTMTCKHNTNTACLPDSMSPIAKLVLMNCYIPFGIQHLW